ncbi:phosphotyrosine protein phosphatase [Salinivibrio kushneri]|uniref:arsenate reductase/protein-tyrosine-phosphatase family protein n=1 Tax=Salinivibrio kushneri TaxID=1908198 RepID=UPI00098931FB|nr:phosphotyrosine protein phosphatase [Salinivibrio kushneri]OOE49383.1 phosphotyrosine protein phosphatase [Salinivibrio kushneri]OOE52133.1 phosphotyrosine protein phosphatase [Salinivibrio kushneri]
MFNKILVVCVGNICRSPTGERLLRESLPTKTIDSAGVGALVGKPANEQASRIAAKHGVDLGGHEARQLTASMCHEYDLILVMESKHKEDVCRIAPEARGKTMLFGHYLTQTKDIPDPYRQSDEAFDYAYDLITQAAQKWCDVLR